MHKKDYNKFNYINCVAVGAAMQSCGEGGYVLYQEKGE